LSFQACPDHPRLVRGTVGKKDKRLMATWPQQVPAQRKAIHLEASMQDASYLRSQAELCLQIARAISDYEAAENLRAVAAQYLVRSLEAEPQLETAEPNFLLAQKKRSLMAHYFFRADYRGISVNDDVGEEFSTLQDAKAHAT
jgi:hypothetical protein